jgi:hypothetical protein
MPVGPIAFTGDNHLEIAVTDDPTGTWAPQPNGVIVHAAKS